jgi:hypothetical protein
MTVAFLAVGLRARPKRGTVFVSVVLGAPARPDHGLCDGSGASVPTISPDLGAQASTRSAIAQGAFEASVSSILKAPCWIEPSCGLRPPRQGRVVNPFTLVPAPGLFRS